MKYITIILMALLHLPALAQQNASPNRKSQIEQCTKPIYSITEFIQMTIDELCNYPIISPIKRPFRISSKFGMRIHPITKKLKPHKGIDIPKPKGTLIYATGNGMVIAKGYNSSYGNFLGIRHAGGFSSFYAHLDSIFVNIGDSVQIMDTIASVGNTGLATGYHLHYEVRKE